ncbi:hypothetical protein LELG_02213 [Lodderomyces elongisporus NRRL YB-4239]|uniref:Zn(2)-C6 fungal-type domain-containing protein n=1 Tax=Lodderomyces elongisporus (strain ATCC 11503 / CBS 2605 / JCM 1781 / NBRC 1676 / NRRL YB-4239) TaxID=379508 RepID=A5DXX6_LODEL|nr:hypothetical protein LELG_02213 [Lodderomyces elongisporus NRRL YB-4239]
MDQSHFNYSAATPQKNGSNASTESTPKKIIKKRKYSRGGCVECKRRRIKCDESKPDCHNCSRLNKTCVYRVAVQRYKFVEGKDEYNNEDNGNTNLAPGENYQSGADNGNGNGIHKRKFGLPSVLERNEGLVFRQDGLYMSLPVPQQLPQQVLQHPPSLPFPLHQPLQQPLQQQQPTPLQPQPLLLIPLQMLAQHPSGFRYFQGNNSNIRTPPSTIRQQHVPIHGENNSSSNLNEGISSVGASIGTSVALPIGAGSIGEAGTLPSGQVPAPAPAPVPTHLSQTLPAPPPSSSTTTTTAAAAAAAATSNSSTPVESTQQPMDGSSTESKHVPGSCKKYKIADVLSPPKYDFLNDTNWGSIAPEEVRTLFDDARLLVHDSFNMFGIELTNYFDPVQQHHQLEQSQELMPQRQVYSENDNQNNASTTGIGSDENGPLSQFRSPHKPMSTISADDVSIATTNTFPDFPIEEISHKLFVKSNPLYDDEPLRSNKELIDSTLKNFNLAGPHEAYLNKLTNLELSFHFFPFAQDIESNEVVKILLKYSQGCSYLLTSLLSSSATFLFIQTRKQVHEQNRAKYTSICLKLLSEAFPQDTSADGPGAGSMANDIEKLLLTILVLTSCFTAMTYFQQKHSGTSDINSYSTTTKTINNNDNNSNNSDDDFGMVPPPPPKALSWKTHLRGVKDLLMKYTQITRQCPSKEKISNGLALARTWFFAIESLAELNDPLGGTLKYVKENISRVNDIIKTDSCKDYSDMSHIWLETGYFNRERNVPYHDALLRINLLTLPHPRLVQFNLFLGYSIDVVKLIDEFTKCLDLLRDHNGIQISGTRVTRIMALMDKARMNEIAPDVDKETFLIPPTSPAHPSYSAPDRIELLSSCYGSEVVNGDTLYYSWFDWSEQLHISAMAIKFLTTRGLLKLPKTHPLLRELKLKVMNSMFFIKPLSSLADSSGQEGPRDTRNQETQGEQNNNDNGVLAASGSAAPFLDDVFVKLDNFYISKTLFDARAIMAQSVFRICLKICEQDNEFERLELYFRALVKLGNGSSLIALDFMKKKRLQAKEARIKNGVDDNAGGGREESDGSSDVDIVPFS